MTFSTRARSLAPKWNFPLTENYYMVCVVWVVISFIVVPSCALLGEAPCIIVTEISRGPATAFRYVAQSKLFHYRELYFKSIVKIEIHLKKKKEDNYAWFKINERMNAWTAVNVTLRTTVSYKIGVTSRKLLGEPFQVGWHL